ncbi:Holliday junction branch migration protein RuvA [Galbitalea sp. SE-J8]|uniref:Holliday junction branch migration protein RuvA n=1 Tax=Galbitalea sp. SE-J8 TaxID=3054952 RepID=UPI00259CBA10|nr:Holliday junction branch migration protein RuvA [Galbitalea sp. SE-J8]MDM4763236.1 Holliday junction branch migration protein RuvA [Galbitalea sp. SE-J8]
MISSVRGTVLAAVGSSVVIEVGGVGLAVQVTPAHALTLRIGSEARVHTALIVREDDLSLFGFATPDELAVFDLLRGVSGVGPKSALGVLAAMTPDEVARAVASEDDGAFRKVSGIGPKTARLIAVSLQGKLVAIAPAPAAPAARASVGDDVVVALTGLGWPERVAVEAVADALADAGPADAASVPALLRRALALLGPAGVAP